MAYLTARRNARKNLSSINMMSLRLIFLSGIIVLNQKNNRIEHNYISKHNFLLFNDMGMPRYIMDCAVGASCL